VYEHASSNAMTYPPKTLALFGATGTIGDNTLAIIREHPSLFQVDVLTAGNNAEKLIALAHEFLPKCVVVMDIHHYKTVRDALPHSIQVLAEEAGLCEAAASDYECMVMAITGFAALKPTLTAIRAGRSIALANKECLVAAGELFMRECKAHHSTLIPIDSEHSGLFQLWQGIGNAIPHSVTLTASGGPFRLLPARELKHVTVAQAIAHPNWTMGAKISVDSATLMNKGLELIEAQHLFSLPAACLSAVIHPQSIMHCIIAFEDGSQLAQLSLPDMRTPIAYALHYPHRLTVNMAKLSLAEIGTLTFEAIDAARFPCFELAMEVMQAGEAAPLILNAANEVAVEAFLSGRITFTEIASLIRRTLDSMGRPSLITWEDVYALDAKARRVAQAF
jgi:1-deoxy-D-xylulose-5-phosphate reductoisomerase